MRWKLVIIRTKQNYFGEEWCFCMISPRVVISVIIVDNFETITILRRRARGVFWMELGKTHRADTEASTQSSLQ